MDGLWVMGGRKHPTIFVGFPLRKEEAGNLSQATGDDGKLGETQGPRNLENPDLWRGSNLILVIFIDWVGIKLGDQPIFKI